MTISVCAQITLFERVTNYLNKSQHTTYALNSLGLISTRHIQQEKHIYKKSRSHPKETDIHHSANFATVMFYTFHKII